MRRLREGHSLIEMLVVIGIVAGLLAVVVPAALNARKSARLAQNLEKQRQLASAIQGFVSKQGHFPGYKSLINGTEAGWVGQILPFIGRNDVYASGLASTPYIEILVSPLDQGPRDQPRLSYVVNGGLPDQVDPVSDGGLPVGTTFADGVDGMFYDHTQSSSPRIGRSDVTDGLRNTLLLTENLDARLWTDVSEPYQCVLWQSVASPFAAGKAMNQSVGSALDHTLARPSSNHADGVVAAFADNSARFIVDSIDAAVYLSMLTPKGKQAGIE
ncbi:MAG: DUF1559 domain-containing protein [Pirellulales bacterium]|nr:DUF1559 domain-containing protein [Pirellulales bacterium]